MVIRVKGAKGSRCVFSSGMHLGCVGYEHGSTPHDKNECTRRRVSFSGVAGGDGGVNTLGGVVILVSFLDSKPLLSSIASSSSSWSSSWCSFGSSFSCSLSAWSSLVDDCCCCCCCCCIFWSLSLNWRSPRSINSRAFASLIAKERLFVAISSWDWRFGSCTRSSCVIDLRLLSSSCKKANF